MEETRGGVTGYQDSSQSGGGQPAGQPGAQGDPSKGTTTGSPGAAGGQGTAAGSGGNAGGSQSPFQHERLRQMTNPQEVERYVSMLENTVRDQGTALSVAARSTAAPAPAGNTGGQPTGQGDASQTPFRMPSNEDYWNNPVEANTRLLTHLLREQMQPLVSEFQAARREIVQPSIRDRLRNDPELKHFAALEQNINAYLQQQGKLGQENEADLRQAYFTVVGWAYERGVLQPGGGAPAGGQPGNGGGNAGGTTEGTQNNNPNAGQGNMGGQGWFPPQHSASSAPLPNQPAQGGTGGQPVLRELTEHERTLANYQYPGLPYEEQRKRYLGWVETPPDQVVNSRIGVPDPNPGAGAGGAR